MVGWAQLGWLPGTAPRCFCNLSLLGPPLTPRKGGDMVQHVTVTLSPLHAFWLLSAAHCSLPPSRAWRSLQPMQGDLPFPCPPHSVSQAVPT